MADERLTRPRVVMPESRSRWLPHAFREDLSALCQSGRATTGRILDLLEKHGLQVVRIPPNQDQ